MSRSRVHQGDEADEADEGGDEVEATQRQVRPSIYHP
jgi:hypothetical protein